MWYFNGVDVMFRYLVLAYVGTDFDMSQIQREHAAIIEHYVPDLKALRQKVCSDLSEDQFWMIYFILLLPRLDENDASLLSTPKVRSCLSYFMYFHFIYVFDDYALSMILVLPN